MAASHSSCSTSRPTSSPEVTTAAGFLAGESGRTREAYTLDLRQFMRWCDQHCLGLFEVTRTHPHHLPPGRSVGPQAPGPAEPPLVEVEDTSPCAAPRTQPPSPRVGGRAAG